MTSTSTDKIALKINEILHKKFLGVPALYWALVASLAAAYLAYKLKPTSGAGSGTAADGSSGSGAEPGSGGDLSSLDTTGTVVVQPSPAPVADAVQETNDKWLRAAVNYLVNDAKVATVGDAQLAMATYLDGGDLTFDQGILRDKAVLKLGLPPEGLPGVGKTSAAPAQKQFTNFPGHHTVKGSNDNTASKLAALYYGSGDSLHANRIEEMNTKLGPVTTTYTPGTVVAIPPYVSPTFYTVTGKNKDQYSTALAAKFGISVAMLQGLNPGLSFPVPVGTKVRQQ